jgi:formylglycine-generating enzyme required for sulfatase activity
MSQFGRAIGFYRNGAWTREQVLSEVDRQLTDQTATPDALLVALAAEHLNAPLPADLHRAISQHIVSWLHSDTVLRPSASTDAFKPLPVEDSRTVLIDAHGDHVPYEAEEHGHKARVDVGDILQGRFILAERIGEGGMSTVFKAMDLRRVEAESTDPFVAVKVLTGPFSHYFGSIQTLHREAHKLQSLTHPNIVRVIDVDRDGQTVYMTMELLSGESLYTKVSRAGLTGMPVEEAQPIVGAIGSALEFAHRSGIVHGDLKPGNVIITAADAVRVIDFGIARFLGRTKEGSTGDPNADVENLKAVTPPYASPEMFENEPPDARDDVYALACIAYELLTGVHPFSRLTAVKARDAGMKPERRGLARRHYNAITAGLQFDRRRRTVSAQAFIDQFTGKRSSTANVRWISIAAMVVAACLLGLYFLRSTHTVTSVEQAAAYQPGQVFRDCPTCPLMRVLPAGKFIQGSTVEAAEQPQHQVIVPAAVAFAVHEVAVGEFREFAEATQLQSHGCSVYDGEWKQHDEVNWSNVEDARTALYPVSCVSWDEATAYVQWLSKRTGRIYRLPSASEWEYAASAGGASSDSLMGNAEACKFANIADATAAERYPGWDTVACIDKYPQSAPVGSFAANAFGLYDMVGNVFEWTQDCWNGAYDGAPQDASARLSGDCQEREMRGGSWFTSPRYLRASYRNRFPHDYRSTSVGFRVVGEVSP